MKRIMIVEDELIIAMSYKSVLQKAGFEVPKVFTAGEQAVEALSEVNPDIILMDIKLKGEMDGIEAAKLIRKMEKIPIIFLSGNNDVETAGYTLDSAEYMVKPINMVKLIHRVKELLQ